ncbi:MAG: nucleotidyl transferase AbiEii/AbiGii toxin family protein [Bifidobacteriaceae bacterium]|nr:nucleotidyl transferase AbiEii/AbiGii toxin family protein [Bifidobacteriaceae bacterium]
MSVDGGYAGWRAVEQAIKQAAKRAHEADPTREVEDIIRQAHHDRFLCRVFADGTDEAWVIKGGAGMLARVANTRRTQDIALYREGRDKDESLLELRRLAAADLGDFFSFAYHFHTPIGGGDNQPNVDGYHVVFDASLGLKSLHPIQVDLAASVFASVGVVEAEPANRLPLARLVVFPYRLYPVANQIADKVTATVADYRGRPSSREKDLVDLVVLALTQTVRAEDVREALATECHLRGLPMPQTFAVPPTWGVGYARLAARTPPAAAHASVEAALALMRRFIAPVLDGRARGSWDPSDQMWEQPILKA